MAELPPDPVAPSRPPNFARNAYHVANAVFVVLLVEWVLTTPALRVGVATAGLVSAWGMEIARRADPRVNTLLMQVFARVAHPHEALQINSATWFTTAVFVMALFVPVSAGVAGLMVLGFGDPAAARIGRRFGRTPIGGGRTLEGSLGFVAVGAAAAWAGLVAFHADLPGAVAMATAAAVAGALGELVARRVDDNLTIPLCGSAAAWAVGAALGVA